MSHDTGFADTPIDLCYDPCLAAFRSPIFILADCESEEGVEEEEEEDGGGEEGEISWQRN